MKQEIINKYKDLTINQLESKVESMDELSRQSQKEMYECLEYLRHTNRFKENSRYKKSTFWNYIEDRFTIREATYRNNVFAFLNYSDFAIEYGVGLVNKIAKSCGRIKINKVIDEIKKEEKATKQPIKREKIENIINKNSTPKIEKTITDWKAMYEAEKSAHEATKQELKKAMGILKEKEEQIGKLKASLNRFKPLYDFFKIGESVSMGNI